MRKNKTPRGKVRGKNMKKIFACLLSLSMIPVNGVAVFATQKQAENASVQKNADVKTQADNTQESEVKFAQDSLTSKIGHFNRYYLEGIDASEIDNISVGYSQSGIVEINSVWDYPNNVRKTGYMVIPKKEGSTEVTLYIRKTDGTQVIVGPTTLTVEKNDDDNIVPITSRMIFEKVVSGLNLSYSKTKYITKNQMLKVKKLDFHYNYIDNLDGIEYAKNCEEIDLSNSYGALSNQFGVNDISKLAQLTNLRKLDLSNTKVSDISALTGLKKLTYLNLYNTQVSAEDRLSLLKTSDVSIEEGSEATDLLDPKGLIQTADKLTSSDSSVVSVESKQKSDGTNEWIFKAAEGKEGQSATITVENGTVKKNIKVNVVAKDESAPDFSEKSVDTNIGCFAKIPLKNADDKNIEITSSDEKVVKIARQYTYIDGKEKYVYRFEPKGTGKAKLIANFETDDGTKYRKYLDVNVGEVKDGIVPLRSYANFNNLSSGSGDEEITEKQLASKETLYLYGGDLEDSDMKWIVKAKKCKVLNLSSNSKISDIEQLQNLKNLKELYLEGTSVSSIEALEKIKDNLEYLNIQNTKISEDDRFKLIPDEVTISEGTKSAKALYPNGLIEYQDTLSVEDNTIADVEEDRNYYHNAWMIVAKKGQAAKTTKLTIKNKDGKTKVITINVIKRKEDEPGFAETKMETSIGRFKEIKLKNFGNLDYNSMRNIQMDSDNENVEIKSVWESNDRDEEPTPRFVLMPKKAGNATITLTYKENGITYEDNMDVTVGKVEDDVVPITNYDFYKALNRNFEKNSRTDCIKKSALASLEEIDLAYSGLTDLTGIEYATDCKEINLRGNGKLKNINRLEKLNNLESIDLSNTAVSSVDSIKKFKNQLVYLDLEDTNISAKDRLDFIREDQKITVEEGASKQIKLMPDGILEDSDQYSVDNESQFSINKPDYGYSRIDAKNAKEGETANLIVKNDSAAGLEKHIPIEVISKKNKIPKFAKKSMTIEIGNLQEMQFKNVTKNMNVTVSSDNEKVLDYAYRGNKIHFVPKSEGTTTIHAKFEKENGTVYSSDIQVTVKKADESENIVPIKSMDTYDSLKDLERKSVDENCDYKITQSEMDNVKEINLSDNLEDEDFAGLDYARNCEEFYFSACDVDYNKELLLNLLKNMKNLKTLSLNCTNFTQKQYDQAFEENNYDQLESLSLYSENIQNIECIKNLKQLQYLDLSHTNVSDISVLENMTKLKTLRLDWLGEIKDFSVITKLTDLEELHLEDTNFKDVKLLSGLTKLNCIDLEGTNISIEDRISLLRTKEIEIEDGESIDYAIYPKGILDYRDEIKLEKNIRGVSCGKTQDEHGVNLYVRAKEGVTGATNIIIGDGEDIYATIPLSVVSEKSGTPRFKEKEKTVSLGYVGDLASELENTENIESVIFDMKDEEYGSKILDIENDEISGKTYLTTKATGKDTIIAQITTKDGKYYKKEMTVNVTENPSNILPISNYKIFNSLLDSEGNSVDKKEKDGLISTTEILDVAQINANYSSVEDADLDYLKKAVNVKKVDLSDNKAITDLSFLAGFNKLKEINLDGDEKITDYTALIAKKDQLEKVVLPAEASDSVRKDMISTDKFSVNVGETIKKIPQPDGLIFTSDKVTVKDPDILDAKIVENEGEEASDEDDILNAHIEITGKKVGTTTLTIKIGKETKEIVVSVKQPSEDQIATFNVDSLLVNQATFKKWNFKNVDNEEIKNVRFTYDGNDTSDILEIVENSDGTYTPIAKKDSGEVTVGAKIEFKNGLEKKVEEAKFTVAAAPEEAVIIKDYDLYKGMKNNGKSADVDQNGIISKDEIANVDEIEVLNSEIKDLTGVEQAVNCKKVDFSNDAFLKDISALSKLTNLTSVNLRDTAVENIDALKGLTKLETVNLDESYVKESDKIALLRLNDMSMTEGETKTQEIIPTGVLGKDIDVSIDSDIAEAKIVDGKLEITGKTVGVANLTIGNKGKKETRTINVTVQKKQEEPKPNPNPGDNKPQTPSQNPTTEAPKPTQPTTATPQKVEKITVKAPSNKISAGKKVKLTANISNDASNKNIKWTTSNKKYATVDKNGVVKFNKKAAGKTVTITAMATDGSGKKATFKIKIMKGSVQKITISGKKSVKAGKALSLKAKVKASKGANTKLIWTSSNEKYATVSSSGKVKALAAGKKKSVKITATATDGSGKKATVTIKIK